MNFKKIFAGAIASALAVTSLAAYASAGIVYIPTEDEGPVAPGCTIDANWLIQLYNTGNEAENKPPTDYGLDLQAINSFTYYLETAPNPDPEAMGITLDERDPEIDQLGGGVIYSANGGTIGKEGESPWYDEENGITMFGKYNWPNNNGWWGLPDKDDSAEGQEAKTNTGDCDYGQKLHLQYLNYNSYKLEMDISRDHADDPDYVWPAGGTCYQVGLQVWGSGNFLTMKVDMLVIKDKEGNIMIGFDGLGNKLETADIEKMVEEYETPKEEEPVESTPAESEDSSEESKAPADDNSGDNTTTPDTTTAPNPNPTTPNMLPIIIAIVAVVVVVVIIVIVVVVKKKKNS